MAARSASSCYVILSSPLVTTGHIRTPALNSDIMQVAVCMDLGDVAVGSSKFESPPRSRVR
jgi:hypothetical protein